MAGPGRDRRLRDTFARALKRALVAEGFAGGLFHYTRALAPPFVLAAQFDLEWTDDGAVRADPDLYVDCPPADEVLDRLDRSESAVVSWYPDAAVVVAAAGEVDAAVAGLLEVVRAGATELAPFADVDAFVAAVREDREFDAESPFALPAVLAVAGRREAARAALADCPDAEFVAHFTRWLDGEPLSEPHHDGGSFNWGAAFAASLKKSREKRDAPRDPDAPGLGDLLRAGRSFVRMVRDELPLDFVTPVTDRRSRGWFEVELSPSAGPVLERAARASPWQMPTNAGVEVELAAGDAPGQMRALVDGVDVGAVALPDDVAAGTVVAGEVKLRGAPSLRVQLRSESP